MPKKSPKKRKKSLKKLETAEMRKEEMPTDPSQIISSLISLQASSGWQILLKIFDDNIKYLEKAILDKYDVQTGKELSDQEVEELRAKRSLNIEVRDTPLNYINLIKAQGAIPDQYDPYYQKRSDMKPDEQ